MMKQYRYEGIDAGGAKLQGVVEAPDRADAIRKAREFCRVLVKLEPVKGAKVNAVLQADVGMLLSGGRISVKKLALLSSQLAIELKAGLPLVRALRLSAEHEEERHLKNVLTKVADDVESGIPLSKSFRTHAPKLPATFLETIRAGEASGALDKSFDRLRIYYEKAAAISSKVGSAMIYPSILLAVAVVVVVMIMIFAVPVFQESFVSLGNRLPLPTRVLIGISDFMVGHLWLLVIVVLALILGGIFYGRTDAGRHTYAKLSMTLPGISRVNRMNAAAQFATTMTTMLSSGLTLVQALKITAGAASNLLIREDLQRAIAALMDGRTISGALMKSRYFPPLLVEMASVGEQTGNMEETLEIISDYYTKEVDVAVKRALGILEPCITLALALLVVFILLAVYMPIFSMYGSI